MIVFFSYELVKNLFVAVRGLEFIFYASLEGFWLFLIEVAVAGLKFIEVLDTIFYTVFSRLFVFADEGRSFIDNLLYNLV